MGMFSTDKYGDMKAKLGRLVNVYGYTLPTIATILGVSVNSIATYRDAEPHVSISTKKPKLFIWNDITFEKIDKLYDFSSRFVPKNIRHLHMPMCKINGKRLSIFMRDNLNNNFKDTIFFNVTNTNGYTKFDMEIQ